METTGNLSTPEAIVGIYVCCAAADGNLSTAESMRIVNFTSRSKYFVQLGNDGLTASLNKVNNYTAGVGIEAALTTFASLVPAELKLAVYANACDLIMSDGTLEAGEIAVIQKIQLSLGIAKEDADAIVKVLAIKNSL